MSVPHLIEHDRLRHRMARLLSGRLIELCINDRVRAPRLKAHFTFDLHRADFHQRKTTNDRSARQDSDCVVVANDHRLRR